MYAMPSSTILETHEPILDHTQLMIRGMFGEEELTKAVQPNRTVPRELACTYRMLLHGLRRLDSEVEATGLD